MKVKSTTLIGVCLIIAGFALVAYGYGIMFQTIPGFVDPDYPVEKVEDYNGYEIWRGTDTKFDPDQGGLIHVPIFWEYTHPYESVSYDIADVRSWIDQNLTPLPNGEPPDVGPPIEIPDLPFGTEVLGFILIAVGFIILLVRR